MNRNSIYNEKRERMFDVIKDDDGNPLLQVKTGKGNSAYRYMDARDAVEEISKAITRER